MQPAVAEAHVRNIQRLEKLLDEEAKPEVRQLLRRLIEEETEFLHNMPFRWGAPPTD
jgi:hypothetical protein